MYLNQGNDIISSRADIAPLPPTHCTPAHRPPGLVWDITMSPCYELCISSFSTWNTPGLTPESLSFLHKAGPATSLDPEIYLPTHPAYVHFPLPGSGFAFPVFFLASNILTAFSLFLYCVHYLLFLSMVEQAPWGQASSLASFMMGISIYNTLPLAKHFHMKFSLTDKRTGALRI